jgi:hypothetical protein
VHEEECQRLLCMLGVPLPLLLGAIVACGGSVLIVQGEVRSEYGVLIVACSVWLALGCQLVSSIATASDRGTSQKNEVSMPRAAAAAGKNDGGGLATPAQTGAPGSAARVRAGAGLGVQHDTSGVGAFHVSRELAKTSADGGGGGGGGGGGRLDRNTVELRSALVLEERTYALQQSGMTKTPKNIVARVGSMGINIYTKDKKGTLSPLHTFLFQKIRCQLFDGGVIIYQSSDGVQQRGRAVGTREVRLTGLEGEDLAFRVHERMERLGEHMKTQPAPAPPAYRHRKEPDHHSPITVVPRPVQRRGIVVVTPSKDDHDEAMNWHGANDSSAEDKIARCRGGQMPPSIAAMGSPASSATTASSARQRHGSDVAWDVGDVVDIDAEDGIEYGAVIIGAGDAADERRVRFADGVIDSWPVCDFSQSTHTGDGLSAPHRSSSADGLTEPPPAPHRSSSADSWSDPPPAPHRSSSADGLTEPPPAPHRSSSADKLSEPPPSPHRSSSADSWSDPPPAPHRSSSADGLTEPPPAPHRSTSADGDEMEPEPDQSGSESGALPLHRSTSDDQLHELHSHISVVQLRLAMALLAESALDKAHAMRQLEAVDLLCESCVVPVCSCPVAAHDEYVRARARARGVCVFLLTQPCCCVRRRGMIGASEGARRCKELRAAPCMLPKPRSLSDVGQASIDPDDDI